MLIVDSIQTLSRADLEGGPGTVTQVRECGLALLHYAKGSRTPVFLVGHVTKDGAVAGPRVLEHMVDAVLYLEGERYQHYRVLRAAKNRFGSTNELGVFEMLESGLREVANPSEAFLSDGDARRARRRRWWRASRARGRCWSRCRRWCRRSFYGTPQRVTSGFDPRRLAVLLAVLERRVGLRARAARRVRDRDRRASRWTIRAPTWAWRWRSRRASGAGRVLERTLALGEVSLSGELRRVPRLDARLREAAQLGLRARRRSRARRPPTPRAAASRSVPLTTLREAFELLLGEKRRDAARRGRAHAPRRGPAEKLRRGPRARPSGRRPRTTPTAAPR